MASRDMRLIVQLTQDTKGINQGVQGLRGQLSGYAKTVGRLGAGLGLAIGAREAISWLGDAVSQANALEQAQGKIRDVFGDSARDVSRFASTSSNFYRLSTLAASDAIGTFGALAKGVGITDDRLADVSQTMTQLAEDLSAFGDVDVGQAIRALQSGLAGESEPLRRFGIDLRKARVEADALASGLADASEAEKILNSLMLQSEGIGILGAAAREADSASGKIANLNRKMADLQLKVGQMLAPWQEMFVDTLLEAITNLETIAGMIGWIGDLIRETEKLEGLDPLALLLGGPAGGAASMVAEQVRQFQDLQRQLGLTDEAYRRLVATARDRAGTLDESMNLARVNKELQAFLQTAEGAAAIEYLGGDLEALNKILGRVPEAVEPATDALAQMPRILAETVGQAKGQGFSFAEIINEALRFDAGAVQPFEGLAEALDPRKLVAELNQELKAANKAIAAILADPQALNQSWGKVEQRLNRLLAQLPKLERIKGPAGKLGRLFVIETAAGIKEKQQSVVDRMNTVGIKAGEKFVSAGTLSYSELRSMFPNNTSLTILGRSLGTLVGLGFVQGFRTQEASVQGTTSGSSQGTGQQSVTIYANSDPATIEAAVNRALRRDVERGVSLANPLRAATRLGI